MCLSCAIVDLFHFYKQMWVYFWVYYQNPPAFKIHSIKIHPIKIYPSQNPFILKCIQNSVHIFNELRITQIQKKIKQLN